MKKTTIFKNKTQNIKNSSLLLNFTHEYYTDFESNLVCSPLSLSILTFDNLYPVDLKLKYNIIIIS